MSARLPLIEKWLGDEIVHELDAWRTKAGEIRRRRKLGTAEMIWLMLGVAIENQRRNLHEILLLAMDDHPHDFKVTVSAFCQGRTRFSPRGNAPPVRDGRRPS